jgi:hypothetical protein
VVLPSKNISAIKLRNSLGETLNAICEHKTRYMITRWRADAAGLVTAADLTVLEALADISARDLARMPVSDAESEVARAQLLAWRKALDLDG